MSTTLRDLRLLLDDFVDGAPFWPFWNAFVEHGETFDADVLLSPAGRQQYDALYELVYLGVGDPVDEDGNPARGAAGDAERALRERVAPVRLEAADGRMV